MDFPESSSRRQGPSLKVGRIWGVEVWFHWILLAFIVLDLISFHIDPDPPISPFPRWAIGALALLLAVFLHEMGHVAMARRVGGTADEILLWPLGGLAFCKVPPDPLAELWVAAGGPLVNLALCALGGVACWLLDVPFWPTIIRYEDPSWGIYALQSFNAWNAFPLVLNLLPCYPLDGGQMLFAVLWRRHESRVNAAVMTRLVSRVTVFVAIAGAIAIFGWEMADATFRYQHPFLSSLGWGLPFVVVFYLMGRGALLDEVHGEGEEAGIFGYDFSRGYTSLEGTQTRTARRQPPPLPFRERLRLRRDAIRRQRRQEVQAELDALLEKVHQEGLEGLSPAERRFLRRTSRLFRD